MLRRSVNGRLVELTPAEEAAVRAEWAAPAFEPLVPLSRRQLLLWLLDEGVPEEAIDGLLAQVPGREGARARIEWKHSTRYEREHPMIEMIGGALGFTRERIDAGWREAQRQ